MHHCLGERHGVWRKSAAPSGAAASRRAERGAVGGFPGRRNAWTRVARGREESELIWAHGAGGRGNRDHGTAFGACGQKRVVAVADRISKRTETGLFDAWRTGSSAGAAAGHHREVSMEGGGGAISGYRRYWVNTLIVDRGEEGPTLSKDERDRAPSRHT